jgi:hypothetical protein
MRNVNKMILAFLVFSASDAFGQKVKTLTPSIGVPINFSKQEQVLWQVAIEKETKMGYDNLNPAERILIDSMEMGRGPLTEFGCSWYCGGEMYKVSSGSWLKATGNVTYKPENIHDFDLFTAWVPDTINGPIGKKIDFYFKPLSPRINEIMIYNGYIKNIDLFKSNARVKKFKLYINNLYYASLELADTTAQQSFKIPPIRSNVKNKDLILTFEIAEIYKGEKYTDVAVSEINFGGLDVH